MTKEELSALPERPEFEMEMLLDGTTVRHRKAVKFRLYTPQPDDVILFTDESGSWIVDYHLEGGPYKRRFP